jgi:hypothetical protein
MGKVDFSHYRYSPDLVVQSVSRGYRVTDEVLLGTLRCNPPPLTRLQWTALRKLLDPAAERRGRPAARVPDRFSLAAALDRIDEPGHHRGFLQVVAERLRSGRRYTEADCDRAYARRWRRHDRDMIIRALYNEVYERLGDSPAFVENHILGRVEVPTDVHRSRYEKALWITHEFLRDRTWLSPPSPGTMMRIISEDPTGKRRPRT